ncbi:unnamed protein product [Nezara viridula]|uniref:Uncharacterized protein n=1 Tax=Nezara viridula TaxID=85310 RepID=A0A9P0HUK1_NEZVI|nr:unnamed protein product [Nezara viridula]
MKRKRQREQNEAETCFQSVRVGAELNNEIIRQNYFFTVHCSPCSLLRLLFFRNFSKDQLGTFLNEAITTSSSSPQRSRLHYKEEVISGSKDITSRINSFLPPGLVHSSSGVLCPIAVAAVVPLPTAITDHCSSKHVCYCRESLNQPTRTSDNSRSENVNESD